jgi:FPC/CPF motif-containing protein YcgG
MTFSEETFSDGNTFESFLWNTLEHLHQVDLSFGYKWSELRDKDIESPKFGFSICEHPFFVVGLHPKSPRISRRFDYPAIVFNSHSQFDELKKSGIYQRMQQEIRRRDVSIQGSINPMLSDSGESSEAKQYAGNNVGKNWECPFLAKDK